MKGILLEVSLEKDFHWLQFRISPLKRQFLPHGLHILVFSQVLSEVVTGTSNYVDHTPWQVRRIKHLRSIYMTSQ